MKEGIMGPRLAYPSGSAGEGRREEERRGCSLEKSSLVWLVALNLILFGFLFYLLYHGMNTYKISGF